MQFKMILIIIAALVAAYYLLGLICTGIARLRNPLHRLSHEDKVIYLTFDDGIDSTYTPRLLDLLKEQGIRATFFVVASTIEKNMDIVRRMDREGHLIGLHSFSHKNQILQSPMGLVRDFDRCKKIFDKAGLEVGYYRPPWGHVQPIGVSICRAYHWQTVLWNVIVQDWQGDTTAEIICDKLRAKVHGNAVICLHDGRGSNNAPARTIEALGEMLPAWQGEGYCFETVDKLY